MYNTEKIRNLLEEFRMLSNHRIRQWNGALYHDHEGKECGACVGAWCAYFLETPLVKDNNWVSQEGGPYWGFLQGKQALASLLVTSQETLGRTLHKNGANSDPFGTDPWDHDYYDVLCDTVLEITGYDHRAYLRGLPVPLKEVRNHEVLETMP